MTNPRLDKLTCAELMNRLKRLSDLTEDTCHIPPTDSADPWLDNLNEWDATFAAARKKGCSGCKAAQQAYRKSLQRQGDILAALLSKGPVK